MANPIIVSALTLASITIAALLWGLGVMVETTAAARSFRKRADQSLCDLTDGYRSTVPFHNGEGVTL